MLKNRQNHQHIAHKKTVSNTVSNHMIFLRDNFVSLHSPSRLRRIVRILIGPDISEVLYETEIEAFGDKKRDSFLPVRYADYPLLASQKDNKHRLVGFQPVTLYSAARSAPLPRRQENTL